MTKLLGIRERQKERLEKAMESFKIKNISRVGDFKVELGIPLILMCALLFITWFLLAVIKMALAQIRIKFWLLSR